MLPRPRTTWFLVLAALFTIAGCASSGQAASNRGAPSASMQPMAVTAVSVQDPTHVRVTVQVPAPAASCVHQLSGRVTDSDKRRVFLQLTFRSPAPAVGRCVRTALASVRVAVPPLRGRLLSIDGEASWAPSSGSTSYRHCTGPFGCAAPPTNHCDAAWLTLAGHSGELQPERSYRALGCDPSWLVMNINATVTGCQPLDRADPPSGCRVTKVRWFFQFRPGRGWAVVAAGNGAGCAGVHTQVPAFPATLCRGLPAR